MAIKVGGTTVIDDSRDASNLGTINSRTANNIAYAWVHFDGTGTVSILDSDNVSSITDNGVGLYSVNFTSAVGNATYAVNGTSGADSHNVGASEHASGSVTVAAAVPNVQRVDNGAMQVVVVAG